MKQHKHNRIPQHTSEIGVDEAGRGCLAGPLVAAAVFLSDDFDTSGIRDSKLLSAKQREHLYEGILNGMETGTAIVGVGIASVEQIDKINILQATMLAMHTAIGNVLEHSSSGRWSLATHHILIDGNYFRSETYQNTQTVIRGDELHDCIAAASIVAKVTRDRWMQEIADKEYPQYGFKQHKGYATKQHREAILRYGICELHRTLFVRNVLKT